MGGSVAVRRRRFFSVRDLQRRCHSIFACIPAMDSILSLRSVMDGISSLHCVEWGHPCHQPVNAKMYLHTTARVASRDCQPRLWSSLALKNGHNIVAKRGDYNAEAQVMRFALEKGLVF